MPNNGIISKFANLPTEFKADSTAEFNTATDTVVVNKALDSGSKISQKAVTIDQLGELVSASQSPTTFNVSTSGPVIISKNSGEYGDGPEIIADGDSLTISTVELPSGLTWMAEYSSDTEYSNADVVYSIVSGLYTTWVYINSTPTTGQALPSGGSTFNTYWAQLGTQGPAGVTPPNLLNWVGTHSSSNAYAKGSVVKKAGSGSTAGDYIYYALVDVLSGVNLPTLGTSNSNWQLIGSYGTGVTGIAYFGGVAKGNVSLVANSPQYFSATEWKVNVNSGGTNQIGLAITKPYVEFGGPIYFNGASTVLFPVAHSYINDAGLTASNISISAVSGQPGTYEITVNNFFDSFNSFNNVVSIELNDGISLSDDIFMVKYAYDSYDNPTSIKFKMLIFSAGTWTPWISGAQTPRLNVYLKRYNN
jgi:hypothetical protein